jgi:hypothetical protein
MACHTDVLCLGSNGPFYTRAVLLEGVCLRNDTKLKILSSLVSLKNGFQETVASSERVERCLHDEYLTSAIPDERVDPESGLAQIRLVRTEVL